MRTMLDNEGRSYYKGNITYDEIVEWFSDETMTETKLKLCGVLGDPIANHDLEDILHFFLFDKKVKYIEISTNGGIRNSKFWQNMGEMSAMSDKRMEVHWSIDGVTKNDYRENVNLQKVWENFHTYIRAGGQSIWQYIEFDYNVDEIPIAEQIAKSLGIKLYIRKSWRNNADAAVFKSEAAKSIDERTHEEVAELTMKGDYEVNIVCRHKKQNEYFISANRKLWPCCHLQDEYVKGDGLDKILNNYGDDFNNLTSHSISGIIESDWYKSALEKSWDKTDPLHLPRCHLACGDGGKRAVIKKEL